MLDEITSLVFLDSEIRKSNFFKLKTEILLQKQVMLFLINSITL